MDTPSDSFLPAGLRLSRRAIVFGASALAWGGWSVADGNPIGEAFLPKPPEFPCFKDRNAVIAQAQEMSDRLEAYIKNWLDGKAAAELPKELLPKGMDLADFPNAVLWKPEEIKPDQQWGVRPAAPIDLEALLGQFPDPPYYRAKGNRRVAGGILYQGPWGMDKGIMAHGRGAWDVGNLWIRYYAPDKHRGAMAGVPLPKVTYELPDGRQFFLQVDPARWAKRLNRTEPAKRTNPEEPPEDCRTTGWGKQWGIFRAIMSGAAVHTKLASKEYVRRLDKGVCGRGEDLPPPGNYEPSATTCTYINYLVRGMCLGRGMVCVLTGRLPTTPRTRDGEKVMGTAQARYWSLTGYSTGLPGQEGFVGAAIHSIMDDEIVTDRQRRYVLVFSRAEERPENARVECGVTWVNRGPTSHQSWTLRWLSVAPDWMFNKTPHEKNLGWETDWASARHNPSLIGRNSHDGRLGDYLPRVHYLSKEEFERLGTKVTPDRVPLWR